MSPKQTEEVPDFTPEERAAFRQHLADKRVADEAAAGAAAAAAVVAQEAAATAEKEAAELAAKQEAQKAARKANPKQFCGLLVEGLSEPDYLDNPDGDVRTRTINVAGQHFEHVSEDADGVWLYRHFAG